MIHIQDLKFKFPEGHFGLDIGELHVGEGEIFALMGPNGAGKSTLLNTISLFTAPYAGKIVVNGRNILEGKIQKAYRKEMTFVFPQPYLLNTTVFENIALPLKFHGIKNSGMVDEMLQFFKIEKYRRAYPHQLSQGEKHRVVLARAFVTSPKLILLDEPFVSLDPQYKERLIQDLRRSIKLRKATAIFVSQDVNEVLALADRVAVLKNGELLQKGALIDVFTKPSCKEVADLVGVETIAEGRVEKKVDHLCFVRVGEHLLESISACCEGDSVFICLRPENLVIARTKEDNSARNHLKCTITHIEAWKLEYKITLDCGFTLVSSVTRQSLDAMQLSVGQKVYVTFKATALHLIKRVS